MCSYYCIHESAGMKGQTAISLFTSCKWVWAYYKFIPLLSLGKVIKKKIKSYYEPSGPSGRSLSQVSVAWSDYEYFYSPLDGMLVHRRVAPNILLVPIYTPGWREALWE